MRKKLNFKEVLLVGSLLFGLFFGAGNLIFPLELGQRAGVNLTSVTIGFLISAIGLPILGIVATGLSDSDSLFDSAKPAGNSFAYFFTILLYLTIGPGFAIPRTATVSYEVGLKEFVKANDTLFLLVFSLVFFLLAFYFAIKEGNLIDTIGKYMTPIFLILLAFIGIMGLVKPMGKAASVSPIEKYQSSPFTVGIIDGYNTLDAPASLAFAVLIISSIKNLGVKDPADIGKETLKAGLVCLLCMGIVYSSLAFLGSTSAHIMDGGENGAIILAKIASHYLGSVGHILLSLIVFIACLKTAIGLISACSEMFSTMLSLNISYKKYCIIFSIVSFLIANLGLSRIISLSIPVLMFLYPLSIALIFLSIFSIKTGKREKIYKWTLAFTAAAAFFDLLVNLPESISKSHIVENILLVPNKFLPGFSLGFGWVLPAILGFIIGYIIDKNTKKGKITYTTGK
ncbi:branched-chain amino acid transport system II carrier protein [Anaerococcus sp.]|uniref:branched-chain amino acid transport system II carrier protein n=1 Tax=Anaerococcus sp. TaxID=1872515 RepID=UPI002904E495|nr:branched-chain amino acid transport system II carrier protein [Anaerococcus sp.]MDU2598217.1 branched-chain amino acid transport system II carrier protein [Anaerococcus sp.]